MPLIKTSGTKTEMVVSVELKMGMITSLVPFSQASSSAYPCFRYWVMMSVTTMELSIMFPSARINLTG